MRQKKENRVALLLHWAGGQKVWLFLAVLLAMAGGLCIVVPYIEIYRLMDAAFSGTCTLELMVRVVAAVTAAVVLRFMLFGASGVVSHKGAYGALFKVRCMVAEHMAKVPLGALNERRTGDIKTVLNEDIEKLELFLAHNLPDLVCYLVGPVVVFTYLMTVNIPLALISLIPLALAIMVMGMMFRNTDDLMDRANRSITTLNSVMIEYISGMKLIKAYNMGSKSFQKFSGAIQEENAMWNETSRRMGPPYAVFVVIIECGMLLMVPIGGMFFLKGSLAASAFLLFVYVGSMYLTEIRPLQELGTNFANVLNAVTKTKEILDIPIYKVNGSEGGREGSLGREGGTDFPQNHDIELRNVRFSYDGKTDVLQGVNLKINDGERMALVGRSGAGKSTVIELISRFYDVQEGEVLIGGKNVKELDYDTILKNVAIVFQKTFLTRDSVLENIRMGSNATLEEVRAAAKEAQIDAFIMSLPDGYDTKVGSFGSRFSGGEKQRIAIARAILKNAPILILDEATSASDPENQMEIDKAIQNLCKGKTVIVVAHRLSALKMCSRVAVVENHTITSAGTHEEVRKNNAYYRKAWEDYEAARNITYQLEGGELDE
ncbi:ABC transporter [Blautia sp. An249]|uniref:ABC transporter ATP-binding protein n=1 Tax=Blautia sp. An249 TaxID=1965603 RepID=UPI000B3A0AD6|nr:ABC transporter ATP-binding protein [Blautia sp. An249]OUO77558.1 ABC transporter [Blautia sp. An249]